MSPLWPNHLLVWLSARGIAVVLRPAGLRKTVVEQRVATVEAMDQENTHGWQSALNTLSTLLDTMGLSSGTRLTVTVASDFVRYLSLPAQPFAMQPDEKLAYAMAAYHELYGDQVTGWQVQCDDAPPHHATIAVAMDTDMLMAIKLLAQHHSLKLVSVQPYLMTAMNRLCRQVANANGYLAIVEERLLLLRLNQGQYQYIKTYAREADWPTALAQIVTREALIGNDESHQLWVYAPQYKSAALVQLAGWQTSRIGLANVPQGYTDQAFATLEVLA